MLRLAHRGVAPATLDDVQRVARRRTISAALRTLVDATTVSDEVDRRTSSRSCGARASCRASSLGASPRAAVHLLAAAKARRGSAGREFVVPDDVVAVAPAVLRHRLQLRPEAELERYTPDDAMRTAIGMVPIPR